MSIVTPRLATHRNRDAERKPRGEALGGCARSGVPLRPGDLHRRLREAPRHNGRGAGSPGASHPTETSRSARPTAVGLVRTLRAIAAELNDRGMLTRRGGRWHVSTVTTCSSDLGCVTERAAHRPPLSTRTRRRVSPAGKPARGSRPSRRRSSGRGASSARRPAPRGPCAAASRSLRPPRRSSRPPAAAAWR